MPLEDGSWWEPGVGFCAALQQAGSAAALLLGSWSGQILTPGLLHALGAEGLVNLP